jgi:hypothetical protein
MGLAYNDVELLVRCVIGGINLELVKKCELKRLNAY